MWDKIVANVAAAYPPFNDYLIRRFREEKVAGMLDYLNQHFPSMNLFNGALVYQGYHILTPEERIAHMMKGRYLNKGDIQIQKNTTMTVRFDFVYECEIYSFFTEIPYMENHAIVIDGTFNYPLLVTMEKVLHRIKNGVLIQVARAPLTFYRSCQFTAKSLGGIPYRDFVPTTKLHLGRGGKSGKAISQTPILLYHLCVFGLDKTLAKYGFKPGETIGFIESTAERLHQRAGYIYFKAGEGLYLELLESEIMDKFKRRVVLSLLYILSEFPKFTMEDLYRVNNSYFKLVLGQYTYSVDPNNIALLYRNAEEHLLRNESMLDPSSLYALSMIGFTCKDLNDLLMHAFYNIDAWMIYKPNDLYAKRLGSLDHMMAGMIRHITSEQFNIMRNRTGINATTIARFMRKAPGSRRWISKCLLFRGNPEACHDNWLLTCGAKRLRSLQSMEKSVSGPGSKPASHASSAISADLGRTHPSCMVVESILTISSSSPVISGSINVHAEIDQHGNILRPAIADLVEHVFDTV